MQAVVTQLQSVKWIVRHQNSPDTLSLASATLPLTEHGHPLQLTLNPVNNFQIAENVSQNTNFDSKQTLKETNNSHNAHTHTLLPWQCIYLCIP